MTSSGVGRAKTAAAHTSKMESHFWRPAALVAQGLVLSPVEEQLAADARRAKTERASEKARRMSRRFR
jgi:hypothetical protein